VVSVPDLEERTKTLRRFIRIANQLYELSNFHSLMMIVTGLGSSSVSRLKATWKALDKKSHEIFTRLQNLMSIVSNFKQYRAALTKIAPTTPCIPLIALFLSDLTFLDDGNPDEVDISLESGYVKERGCAWECKIGERERERQRERESVSMTVCVGVCVRVCMCACVL
jgi:RasGEF domain